MTTLLRSVLVVFALLFSCDVVMMGNEYKCNLTNRTTEIVEPMSCGQHVFCFALYNATANDTLFSCHKKWDNKTTELREKSAENPDTLFCYTTSRNVFYCVCLNKEPEVPCNYQDNIKNAIYLNRTTSTERTTTARTSTSSETESTTTTIEASSTTTQEPILTATISLQPDTPTSTPTTTSSPTKSTATSASDSKSTHEQSTSQTNASDSAETEAVDDGSSVTIGVAVGVSVLLLVVAVVVGVVVCKLRRLLCFNTDDDGLSPKPSRDVFLSSDSGITPTPTDLNTRPVTYADPVATQSLASQPLASQSLSSQPLSSLPLSSQPAADLEGQLGPDNTQYESIQASPDSDYYESVDFHPTVALQQK